MLELVQVEIVWFAWPAWVSAKPRTGAELFSVLSNRSRFIGEPEVLTMDCIVDVRVSIFPSNWAIRESDSSVLRTTRLRIESDG